MATTGYFLTTERLGFRAWSPDDLELAMGLWGDYEVTRLIDARGPLTREQVAERLMSEIATEKRHGVQYWPVFHRRDNSHIGCCGLRPYSSGRGNDSRAVLEIGFHIRSQCWRKGYASEAARAIIAHAFEHLSVQGLFAGHNPNNTASGRLLLGLGFRYTHDELYEPTGLQHPSYILTARAYRESTDSATPPPTGSG